MNNLQRNIRYQKLSELNDCETCGLHKWCNGPVLGEGPLDAELIIVGESPGEEENKKLRPFVGDTGRLLNYLLRTTGLRRKDIFITNAIKCWPSGKTLKTKTHAEPCKKFLLNELSTVPNAKCIIAFGNLACYSLLGKTGITDIAGYWHNWKGIPVLPMLHPAATLRDWSSLHTQERHMKKVFNFLNGTEQVESTLPTVHVLKDINSVQKFFRDIEGKDFAFDLETRTLQWWKGDILCASFSFEPGVGYVLPILQYQCQKFWSMEDYVRIMDFLKILFQNPNTLKIGFNLKYDVNWLRSRKIEVKGPQYDALIAQALCDENTSHELMFVSDSYGLNYGKWDEGIQKYITKKNPDYSQIPNEDLWRYAGIDAAATFLLKAKTSRHMRKEGLYDVFESISMPLIEVIADMEYEGAKIDLPLLEANSKLYEKRIGDKLEEIQKIVQDEKFNPNSPAQLAERLKPFLKGGKTTAAGRPSVDEEVLSALAKKGLELPSKILELRTLTKTRSTYMEGFKDLLDDNGYIHTNYSTFYTVTGRISSSNPNLQNIPRPRKGEANIRSFFTVEPGWNLISADYAQMEQRMIAYLSKDKELLKIFENKQDIHKMFTALALKKRPEDVTPEERAKGKMIIFGSNYGQSPSTLAKEYGLNRDEAEHLMGRYFSVFPDMTRWREDQHKFSIDKQYLQTVFGRKRRFIGYDWYKSPEAKGMTDEKEIQSMKFALINLRNMSYNFKIQSSSSDYLSLATHKIYKTFEKLGMRSRIFMTIHDAIIVKAPNEEVEKAKEIIKSCMEQRLDDGKGHWVDLTADIKVGTRWSDEFLLEAA